MKAENTNALKQDIDLLGRILGQVILKQNGEFYYDTIEKLRELSKQTRKQHRIMVFSKVDEMSELLSELTPDQSIIVARAFGHFLNLVNIAETVYEPDSCSSSQAILDVFEKVIKSGKSKEDIQKTVENLEIDLVLTAHPTEVKRRTLIQKYSQIAELLIKRSRTEEFAKIELDEMLYTLVTNIWLTDEIRRKRPTPFEEARWGLAVVEEVLWDTVPWYLRRLDTLLEQEGMDRLKPNICPIKIGSWMGGDRDGNPFVTAKVTEAVVIFARRTAVRFYLKDIIELGQQLSLNECSDDLQINVGKSYEPYRTYLDKLREKLEFTFDWLTQCANEGILRSNPKCIQRKSDLSKPLMLIYNSLISVNADAVANDLLLDVIRRVQTFGLALIPMDIRQESERHLYVIAKVCRFLKLGDYLSWSEEEKCEWLVSELKSRRPLLSKQCPFDKSEQEVVDTVQTIARMPRDHFGAYIISMASTASDVLAVCLIQKMCGVDDPLRVAPLFETLDDLNHAPEVLDQLFSLGWYKHACDGRQEVMIGYSDSGKDAGKLAASWALYGAQEVMLKVANKHKIKLCFFHGRGGSVGRGGGPVQAALLSQPPGTVAGHMRVTEQGEVIQQKFGSKTAARRHFLIYISSVLDATLIPPAKPKPEWRKLMNHLSDISRDEYRQTVFSDEKFIEYFHSATPEQELGRLCIGSRPSKRKASGGVESLRAIPWIFAWTQVRLLLPSWLGIEKAFEQAIEEGKYTMIKKMITDWPFFHTFMDSVDMVLAKADRKMSGFYDKLLVSEDLMQYGQQIRDKLSIIKEINLKITQDLNLSEQRDHFRSSLHYRNTYIDPLNLLQADVMHRLKHEKYHTKFEKIALEDSLMLSIAGIAAGLKNTG